MIHRIAPYQPTKEMAAPETTPVQDLGLSTQPTLSAGALQSALTAGATEPALTAGATQPALTAGATEPALTAGAKRMRSKHRKAGSKHRKAHKSAKRSKSRKSRKMLIKFTTKSGEKRSFMARRP